MSIVRMNAAYKHKLFTGAAVQEGSLSLDLEASRILIHFDAIHIHSSGDVSYTFKGAEVAYQVNMVPAAATPRNGQTLVLNMPMPCPLPVDLKDW
jgi:hypothetical protein